MKDTNIIPEESEIYGYVEDLHDPVVGTNASMKIKVTKLVTDKKINNFFNIDIKQFEKVQDELIEIFAREYSITKEA